MPAKPPRLYVEGSDDQHSLIHLLGRHGIDYGPTPWPPAFPEFKPKNSVEQVLDVIEVSVKASTDRPVGFIVDADTEVMDRWRSVRDRLTRVGVETPDEPPPRGFIGTSDPYKTRVGVWLMPDNQSAGALEDFLLTLINEGDPLIGHAESATARALELGACFPAQHTPKATIHTWLAWQEVPGCPYGTAIRARYFRRHDSPQARDFVAWFRALFGIDQAETPAS